MRLAKFLPVALAGLLCLNAHANTAPVSMQSPMGKLITADLATCAKPEWPAESLYREEQGTVVLAFLVGLDGKVLESRIEKSSGHRALDFAAQDGLAKCLFSSPESGGLRAPAWAKLSYVWTLEESETPAETQARVERDVALAAAGDPAAIYQVSGHYFSGAPGIAQNRAESLRMLRKSAELGHAPAQGSLAILLLAGEEMEKDLPQALAWARKAATQGAARAQVLLATLLSMAPPELQDFERMHEALELAVAQGDAEAKGMLGMWLLNAENGDKERGLQLVIDAAEARDRAAQFDLGQLYEAGLLLPQDVKKARALYERSAAAGYGLAEEALVRLRR